MSHLTEEAIKAAFLRLLSERPLTKISVRDIAQECGINRNTFYYHFQDIPAVMEQIALDRTNELIGTYREINSPDECVHACFAFILENRREVYHIYHSLSRDVFEKHLMRICEYTVNSWFETKMDEGSIEPSPDQQKLLRFIRFELFGACINWMNEGMPLEAEEEAVSLLRLCQRLMRQPAAAVPEDDPPAGR